MCPYIYSCQSRELGKFSVCAAKRARVQTWCKNCEFPVGHRGVRLGAAAASGVAVSVQPRRGVRDSSLGVVRRGVRESDSRGVGSRGVRESESRGVASEPPGRAWAGGAAVRAAGGMWRPNARPSCTRNAAASTACGSMAIFVLWFLAIRLWFGQGSTR